MARLSLTCPLCDTSNPSIRSHFSTLCPQPKSPSFLPTLTWSTSLSRVCQRTLSQARLLGPSFFVFLANLRPTKCPLHILPSTLTILTTLPRSRAGLSNALFPWLPFGKAFLAVGLTTRLLYILNALSTPRPSSKLLSCSETPKRKKDSFQSKSPTISNAQQLFPPSKPLAISILFLAALPFCAIDAMITPLVPSLVPRSYHPCIPL